MAVAPRGVWTNERHVAQKNFVRLDSKAPRISEAWETVLGYDPLRKAGTLQDVAVAP